MKSQRGDFKHKKRVEDHNRWREYRRLPEIKERKREYMREYQQRPEAKERRRERERKYRQRPEVKERQREYMRKYQRSPQAKKRRREYMREYRLKQLRKEEWFQLDEETTRRQFALEKTRNESPVSKH